jgi:hypothetical protein
MVKWCAKSANPKSKNPEIKVMDYFSLRVLSRKGGFMRTAIIFSALILLFSRSLQAQKIYELKPLTVSNKPDPDTVFGTWKFSVADYEFYEDKLLLLTFEKSLKHAKVMLADADQRILSSFTLPEAAKELYKDYQGFINVMCEEAIFRVLIRGTELRLASLPVEEYKHFIMPCLDSAMHNIYFSDYSREYPEFNYYAYNTKDSALAKIRTVCDREALKGYNMEYYFLKPRERVQAMKWADEYGVDKHRIAAAMSGLTSSMHYTPLYAPLFVLKDTVYIFDHYSDAVFSFDQQWRFLDSVPLSYHHPKNWREWKHKLLADKERKEVYAVYQKAGYYYLNHIDLQTGRIKGSFKLSHPHVDRLKVRDGYVYYVYSPFESLQEFFVYKELIRY